MSIIVLHSDITNINTDAIVNPANETLLGGGGCDGFIHQKAGPLLLEECRTLGGCKKGEAKLTQGYNIPARFIIHTVGPAYGQENGNENKILASCYINSFELAKKNNCKSIAFPCISTHCYGFPKDQAAKIATDIAEKYVNDFDKIVFVCFTELDYNIYNRIYLRNTVKEVVV